MLNKDWKINSDH